MRNDINEDLLCNIEISESMKDEIYLNCKKNKRTADFTFRYSGVLSVVIVAAVFSLLSIGAAAAYINVRQRLETMPDEEYENYEYEVENDVFAAMDEGYSRSLRDSEILRMVELERDYYDNNMFPDEPLPHLETKAELEENMLAYVAEDNLLYLPEADMTDEQLLQFIDHDAKKWYVNEQALIDEGVDVSEYSAMTHESTPIAAGSTEEKIKTQADKYLKDFYGADASDSRWEIFLEHEDGDEEFGTPDFYLLDYSMEGTGMGNGHQVWIADDFTPLLINVTGCVFDLEAEKYPVEEVEARKDEIAAAAIANLDDLLKLGMPVGYKAYIDEYDAEEGNGKVGFLCIDLDYGEFTAFACVRIEDGKIREYMNNFYD